MKTKHLDPKSRLIIKQWRRAASSERNGRAGACAETLLLLKNKNWKEETMPARSTFSTETNALIAELVRWRAYINILHNVL